VAAAAASSLNLAQRDMRMRVTPSEASTCGGSDHSEMLADLHVGLV